MVPEKEYPPVKLKDCKVDEFKTIKEAQIIKI